jgi:drug/metabolite transporter (DMT)-like permease
MMTASPIAVVLDFIVFKKLPLVRQIEGGLIIMIGIAIAIAYGESSKKIHEPQKNKQRIIGFGVGLVAASSQVCGLLALKPLLQEGVAPLAVTAVRTGGGALLVSLIFVLMASKLKDAYDVNHKVIVSAITPGIMGYCVAVSLQLYALRNLGAGAAILLGSTAPIMVVPLLWIHSRQRQAVGAWIGAGVAISGIAWAII